MCIVAICCCLFGSLGGFLVATLTFHGVQWLIYGSSQVLNLSLIARSFLSGEWQRLYKLSIAYTFPTKANTRTDPHRWDEQIDIRVCRIVTPREYGWLPFMQVPYAITGGIVGLAWGNAGASVGLAALGCAIVGLLFGWISGVATFRVLDSYSYGAVNERGLEFILGAFLSLDVRSCFAASLVWILPHRDRGTDPEYATFCPSVLAPLAGAVVAWHAGLFVGLVAALVGAVFGAGLYAFGELLGFRCSVSD